mgnify:CR=1 FL=1|tara:strand:+ start:168 stop:488 length:321 start_codon:yes stop_codon:yes gene_type:complete
MEILDNKATGALQMATQLACDSKSLKEVARSLAGIRDPSSSDVFVLNCDVEGLDENDEDDEEVREGKILSSITKFVQDNNRRSGKAQSDKNAVNGQPEPLGESSYV